MRKEEDKKRKEQERTTLLSDIPPTINRLRHRSAGDYALRGRREEGMASVSLFGGGPGQD